METDDRSCSKESGEQFTVILGTRCVSSLLQALFALSITPHMGTGHIYLYGDTKELVEDGEG